MDTIHITLRNKYLHTQAQKSNVEISAKKTISAIFKGSNTDFSEMTLKLTQSTPGTFCELPGIYDMNRDHFSAQIDTRYETLKFWSFLLSHVTGGGKCNFTYKVVYLNMFWSFLSDFQTLKVFER